MSTKDWPWPDPPLTEAQRALGWGGCFCRYHRTFRSGSFLRDCQVSYASRRGDWYWFADPNVTWDPVERVVPKGYAKTRCEAIAAADAAMKKIEEGAHE